MFCCIKHAAAKIKQQQRRSKSSSTKNSIIYVTDGTMSRTPNTPISALRYCYDKAQYFGLEFSFYPLLFPNKKTETPG